MESRFFVYTVFATVMQCSLLTLASTSSSTKNVKTQTGTNHSTIQAEEKKSASEFQEANKDIFTCIGYLATAVCAGQKPTAENISLTTKTFEAKVITHLISQLNISLLAIEAANPESEHQISARMEAGSAVIRMIFENVFASIDLAMCKNSSENQAKMAAFKKKALTGPANFSAIYYGVLKDNRRTSHRIEAAAEKTEDKSIAKFTNTIEHYYSGIKALQVAVASGAHGKCEKVFREIKSAWHKANNELNAEVKVKFDLIEKARKSSSKVQTGVGNDACKIEPINMAAMSDNEKAIHHIHTMTHNHQEEVTRRNEKGIVADCAAIGTGERQANVEIQKAISIIFSKIKIELVETDESDQCHVTHDNSSTEIPQMEEYIAFKRGIGHHFETALIADSECFQKVGHAEDEAYAALVKVVEGIRAGIMLKNDKCSSDIAARLKPMEELSVSAAVDVDKHIFSCIKDSQKALEEVNSLIVKLFHTIFTAIEICLSRTIPNYGIEGPDCLCSIENAEKEVSRLFYEVVEVGFDAMRRSRGCSEHQIETIDDFCAHTAD